MNHTLNETLQSAIIPDQSNYSFAVNYTTALMFIVAAAIYALYYWYFNGILFEIKGNYNQKKKHLGKALPPYPNGWYVAEQSRYLKAGESKAVDIAGQNLVIFRSTQGKVYALHAYCAHMGANLGIGGKIVNDKCVQCPFHGWLYDGQTGKCVDHSGKPLPMRTVEYTQDFCQKGKKLQWIEGQKQFVAQRKFPVQQCNGLIHVWIHSMKQHQDKPQYSPINIQSMTKNLQFRGQTKHHINCHIQDIPENGADILHFKYVHNQILKNLDFVTFMWNAKWKRGDDADIKQMFEHQKKYVKDFKQKIYKDYIEPFPEKKYLSIGYLDNYLKLPIIGKCFMFNATIVQYGPATVFIFLRSPLYEVAFQQFLQPQQPGYQVIYHQMYTNSYIPLWLSSLALKMEGDQVTNDLYLWESKRFAHQLHYRKHLEFDQYMQNWRKWYSQYYEGCDVQLKKKEDCSW